jgi:hypothetical protein
LKKDVKKKINALKKHQDIKKLSAKFNANKKSLEMKVKKVVAADIKEANQFLATRKQELNALHKEVKLMLKKKLKNIKKNGH